MGINSFINFWSKSLEHFDLPNSDALTGSSSSPRTTIPQQTEDERYQEFSDTSRVKITSTSHIKQNCNNSIRQNFIEWMFSS